jgi:predicted metal-dependent phosphoesterase TrpH
LLVDLHLHTTASDGRLTPAELVAHAAAAGVTVMAVTDHDTVAACTEVARCARERGIETVTGIEITAVEGGRDVHMLGYFVDIADPGLAAFLAAARETRLSRLRRIAARLTELGLPVDITSTLDAAAAMGRSVGRPLIADVMIASGYVATRREAFDVWLGGGRPAFVPRDGARPEDVIAVAHAAGGVISLAHPGRTALADERIRELVAAGLDAIEVYHSDHDAAQATQYAALADALGILRTGGSDFHGDPAQPTTIGGSSLPPEQWERLRASTSAA